MEYQKYYLKESMVLSKTIMFVITQTLPASGLGKTKNS